MVSCCFFACISLPKKNDNVWLLGYSANQDSSDSFCISVLEFENNNLNITQNDAIEADFTDLNATYCNGTGELLAYSDGRAVYNSSHGLMQNGYGLNYNDLFALCPQSAVMLDYPGSGENKLVLLHTRSEYIFSPINDLAVLNLYYSVIDIAAANGQGKVVEKKQVTDW